MNEEQQIRYRHQILIPEIGIAGQQRLLETRVLIIGVGGLGSPAAMYLAAAGIGTLVISDFDRVEASNLQRQIIHRHADIGESKVLSAKRTLEALNPSCNVCAKAWQLEEQELATEIALADIVLDCSDNFATRFALNRTCVAAQTVLISGAASRYHGQVMTIIPYQGPCYECLYPDIVDAETNLACEQAGIIAPLVGVIGSLQALQAVQFLTNSGPKLAHNQGKRDVGRYLLLFNAATMQWRSIIVPRDPMCAVCG